MCDYLNTNMLIKIKQRLCFCFNWKNALAFLYIINELIVHHSLFQVCIYEFKNSISFAVIPCCTKICIQIINTNIKIKDLSLMSNNLTDFFKIIHSNILCSRFNKVNFISLYFRWKIRLDKKIESLLKLTNPLFEASLSLLKTSSNLTSLGTSK